MTGMNPEIKAKWLEALRGGEYAQGAGRLRKRGQYEDTDRFCCLGVLCDLAVKAGAIPEPIKDVDSQYYGPKNTYYRYGLNADQPNSFSESDISVLPRSVAEWAGLPTVGGGDFNDVGWYGPASEGMTLTERNDSGATFAEIADLIEEHY